jgi:hypothetical protein
MTELRFTEADAQRAPNRVSRANGTGLCHGSRRRIAANIEEIGDGTMLAHEVLRAAAEVVRAGWSHGSAAARDADGNEVNLYGAAVGGTSRVGINPEAARFSVYGAVAKVLTTAQGGPATGLMWLRLAEIAKRRSPSRPGGTNHMHPLVQFNADPERTAEDVVDLLLEAADALAPVAS